MRVERIIEQLALRSFRVRVFSAAVVKTAHGDTCAMTGPKIIYGGGKIRDPAYSRLFQLNIGQGAVFKERVQ